MKYRVVSITHKGLVQEKDFADHGAALDAFNNQVLYGLAQAAWLVDPNGKVQTSFKY